MRSPRTLALLIVTGALSLVFTGWWLAAHPGDAAAQPRISSTYYPPPPVSCAPDGYGGCKSHNPRPHPSRTCDGYGHCASPSPSASTSPSTTPSASATASTKPSHKPSRSPSPATGAGGLPKTGVPGWIGRSIALALVVLLAGVALIWAGSRWARRQAVRRG